MSKEFEPLKGKMKSSCENASVVKSIVLHCGCGIYERKDLISAVQGLLKELVDSAKCFKKEGYFAQYYAFEGTKQLVEKWLFDVAFVDVIDK